MRRVASWNTRPWEDRTALARDLFRRVADGVFVPKSPNDAWERHNPEHRNCGFSLGLGPAPLGSDVCLGIRLESIDRARRLGRCSLNNPDTSLDSPQTAVTTERRANPRNEIPAALVPIGPQAGSREVIVSQIMNLSVSGAKLCCDEPIGCDRIWLAFNADRRMIVEAEIIWSDYATAGPNAVTYGVNFTRMLSEAEFVRLVDTLAEQEEAPDACDLSAREREESLFELFRGHTPQGAKPRDLL